MIIECPSCHSKYQYDEDRFERKPSKKIKCARCQQIFEIRNPAFAKPPAPAVAAGESTFGGKLDDTRTKPAPAPEESTGDSVVPGPAAASAAATPQLPQGKRLSLAILDGPDAGSVYRIDKPRITIGRSNADLTLNDTEASRQHAAIEVRDTNYTLLDLGSTNGTMWEGQKISDPVELQNHSEFVVGGTTLMLIVTEDS